MKLVTKRLVLRDITMKDAKSIAENANNKDVWYYTDHVPYPYKLKDAKSFIKSCKKKARGKPRKDYDFGIELKSERKIIGIMSLIGISKIHKRAVIGYWLGKKYRRQGIISEAEKAILDFAFNKLKLNKISGDAMTENKGSNALFKKFGFRKIGIKKQELIKKGKKKDAYTYELLRKDYKPKKIKINIR